MKKLIRHTEFHNMDVLPANMRLLMANREVMFDQTRPQQYRIKMHWHVWLISMISA